MDEILEITLQVAEVLERLGVPYLVGGSLASSLHGLPRATQDVDLVADLREEHVGAFAAALEADFYLDAEAIRSALRHRSSFNVIHLETMFKIDVFTTKDDEATRQEMQRRQSYTLSEAPQREIVVASPEDVILQKLHWFRLGGEVSDRQWQDVLGVMKVQGDALDEDYLARMAAQMDLADLLRRARREAGPQAA